MTKQSGLMFLDDPEPSKKLLAIEDQDARFQFVERLVDFLICEIMRYGKRCIDQ